MRFFYNYPLNKINKFQKKKLINFVDPWPKSWVRQVSSIYSSQFKTTSF